MQTRQSRRNQSHTQIPHKVAIKKRLPTQKRKSQNPGIPNETTKPEQVQPEPSKNISKNEELKDQLEKLYKDVTSAPSYSAKIAEFLRQHDTHGVYRRIVKKKFPRRKVIARFPYEIFMADLMEYPQYKHANNGYCYILIMIDCFTKMLYAVPMKKKNQEWSAEAFESIFKNFDDYPINLVTDGGLEFFNAAVRKVFDTYGINHYKTPTKTKWKASMAERVIRTLKSRLQKYFKTKNI